LVIINDFILNRGSIPAKWPISQAELTVLVVPHVIGEMIRVRLALGRPEGGRLKKAE
jgi:hypothetical protein